MRTQGRAMRWGLVAWCGLVGCGAAWGQVAAGPLVTLPQEAGPQGAGPQGTGTTATGPQASGPVGVGPQTGRAGVSQGMGPRVVVPIEATHEGGAPRYSVMLSVAGRPMRAGLDTGSAGLHVMARAVSDGTLPVLKPETRYGYGSGLRVKGPEVQGEVALGALHGTLPFQKIEEIGCPPEKPCPADRTDIDHFGLMAGGKAGAGFEAILGIATGPENVLAAMGAQRWIVRLPRAGEKRPGVLILNPTEGEMARFRMVEIIPESERRGPLPHDAIPGCLGDAFRPRQFCGAAVLDTGAPSITVEAAQPPEWGPKTILQLTLADSTTRFEVGRQEGSHVRAEQEAVPRPRLLLGTLPYQVWAVLYDNAEQRLGFAPAE